MYLFYGIEKYLIQEEINKIIKLNNIDDLNIIRYDLEESQLESIIEDASMISIFSEKKLIIIENTYIFTSTTNKKLPEQNVELLISYLKNPNPNTIIIFTILKEKLDTRKKIYNVIKDCGLIKEFNSSINLSSWILNEFKPYKISSNNIKLLLDRVGNNYELLRSEINKIKIYKNKDIEIESNDILNLTSQYLNLDIFKFIENILYRRKEEAINVYSELLKHGEEPIAIIVMLANQIRIMYQAKVLSKRGYTEKDIANILEIHEYRIKKGLENSKNYNENELLNALEKLADLDTQIKTGKIDKSYGLEIFILTF